MTNPNTYQLYVPSERLSFLLQGKGVREQKSTKWLLKEGHVELCVISMLWLHPLLQLLPNIFHELFHVQVTRGFIVRGYTTNFLRQWLLRSRSFCPHRGTGPTIRWSFGTILASFSWLFCWGRDCPHRKFERIDTHTQKYPHGTIKWL